VGLGGDQAFLISAAAPFVQNAQAAFIFYDAFNAANVADYDDVFSSF
jgi:hypothetical protein